MWALQRLLAPVGFGVVAFCYGWPFAALRLDDPTNQLAVDGFVLLLRSSGPLAQVESATAQSRTV